MSKEVALLCQNPPEGIKIITNDEDITDIQASIEGPGTFCDSGLKLTVDATIIIFFIF